MSTVGSAMANPANRDITSAREVSFPSMKIIFVNRFYAPDHSATSQMLTDLAVALAAGGLHVHVVTSRLRYDDPEAALPPSEVIDGVTVHRVRTTRFGRGHLLGRACDYLSFYFAASAALYRLTRAGDIVVAKTDPPLISVPAGWIARLRGASQVNWLQDLFPEVALELGIDAGKGAWSGLLARLRDRSLKSASRNVVLGRAMRDRLTARSIDPASIAVIPNWADGDALHPIAAAANALHAEWGLRDKFVVGYSGNMGRAHEFQTILDAAVALRARSEVVFVFIGGGAHEATVSVAAATAESNIVRKPYQPRAVLAECLSAADVHLVSLRPRLEGLIVPSKFYGIAAVGRPTLFIGDPEGELGETILSAECGLVVREGDVAGLVGAIETLMRDTELRAKMGRNARRVFEERYDKAIAVATWRRLLADVAKESGQRGRDVKSA